MRYSRFSGIHVLTAAALLCLLSASGCGGDRADTMNPIRASVCGGEAQAASYHPAVDAIPASISVGGDFPQDGQYTAYLSDGSGGNPVPLTNPSLSDPVGDGSGPGGNPVGDFQAARFILPSNLAPGSYHVNVLNMNSDCNGGSGASLGYLPLTVP